MVGKALATMEPSTRPAIFTKFGLGDQSEQRRVSATRAQILQECEASLRRLGVDRIDLYQLHWPVDQPVEEVAGACDELMKSGKIAAIGVCNYDVMQLDTWRATGVPLHCLQTPYSLFRPASGEQQIPWCFENGLGSIAYSPLFRGMLFGTWNGDKSFPEGDTRSTHRDYTGPRLARRLQAIAEFQRIAEDRELSVAQLAIGALLGTPGLTGCIVGARNAKQGEALGELAAILSKKEIDAIEAVCSAMEADLAQLGES
jgi:aryl-alcohol dehydrogenase-like predicted oxidoreductase